MRAMRGGVDRPKHLLRNTSGCMLEHGLQSRFFWLATLAGIQAGLAGKPRRERSVSCREPVRRKVGMSPQFIITVKDAFPIRSLKVTNPPQCVVAGALAVAIRRALVSDIQKYESLTVSVVFFPAEKLPIE